MVPRRRLELAPEASASTNSATWASGACQSVRMDQAGWGSATIAANFFLSNAFLLLMPPL